MYFFSLANTFQKLFSTNFQQELFLSSDKDSALQSVYQEAVNTRDLEHGGIPCLGITGHRNTPLKCIFNCSLKSDLW